MSSIESLTDARQIEALAAASDLPARLAAALAELGATVGTPGSALPSARRMSPELSYGRHAGPPPATARAAAVMLLLFLRNGRWHVPLTQRPAALLRHGGQISLPGGRIEPGESSAEAARRELAEELGIVCPIDVLGRLPNRYVYASDYVITPHVAVATAEPQWAPDAREVERVVELPLDVLFDRRSAGRITIQRGPLVFHAPSYVFGEDRIWGATCVILAELGDALHRVLEHAQQVPPLNLENVSQ
jgi:8-oxo-dGTP pyrophosphatase MutT (NUDIX family)